MALNVLGLVGIIIFYLLILGIGVWAALKKKGNKSENYLSNGEEATERDETEEVILAGRSLGLFVGAMTMTGSYGGGVLWCDGEGKG
jgi:high affinity choline transporter 7